MSGVLADLLVSVTLGCALVALVRFGQAIVKFYRRES